jgi:DNA-binding NarL/FixJ family response regulator
MLKRQSVFLPVPPELSTKNDHDVTNAAFSLSDAVRILLVDDHLILRSGLRMLLEKQPGFAVVGEAANRQEALEIAAREKPDIVLLDLDLGDEQGLDFLPDLLEVTDGKARVLLLTGSHDAESHARAVRTGALGVVHKERAPDSLITAIKKVHAGEVWLERTMVATALTGIWARPQEDPEVEKIASLTPREHEVIALIGQGLRNQQIADRLVISEATVRRHLSAIFEKLEVSDRLDLVVYAFQHEVVKPTR